MPKITREQNLIWDFIVLPSIVWCIMLRKEIGSRYIGKSYVNAALLPYVVLFDPFCGQYIWRHSQLTYLFAVIAFIRVGYEFLRSKFGKDRIHIHSDSTGKPRDFWYRWRIFDNQTDVRRYGEPLLAGMLGAAFFFTQFDTFFGGLMLFTAGICVVYQLEFDEAATSEEGNFRNMKKEAEQAQLIDKNVSDKMNKTKKQVSTDPQSEGGFYEVN